MHDTIATLRRLKKEEMIDIAWFGGARSGTDAAKLVGLGVNAIGYGVAVALALGGEITHTGMRFAPDRNEEERTDAVVNILKANAGEASMMARCAGKTRLRQHRAGGPALGDPGDCRGHRNSACGDTGGVARTLHHFAAAGSESRNAPGFFLPWFQSRLRTTATPIVSAASRSLRSSVANGRLRRRATSR